MALPTNSTVIGSLTQGLGTSQTLAEYQKYWTYYIDTAMSYSSIFIVILGIATNIVNIIVFQGQGIKDGVTLTLFTLSLSDLSLCTLLLGASIVAIIKTVNPGMVLDPDSMMMAVFGYSRSVVYCYSTCITVYVSLERSLCVILPFRFSSMFTRKVTMWVLLTMAVSVAALFAPAFTTQGLSWRFDPRYNATRLLIWRKPNIRDIQLAHIINTSFIIPIASEVMVGVCTALMIYGLQASSKFKESANAGASSATSKGNNGQSQDVKEVKAIKMVLYLSIVFFICNLPLVAGALLQIAFPEFQITGRLSRLYATYFGFVILLSGINGAVNFFVYYNHSSRFREVFFKKFHIKHSS